MNPARLLSRMMGLVLGLSLLAACGTPQPAPTSTPTPVPPTQTPVPPPATPTSAILELGQIKGMLVDKDTGQTILDRPALFRDQLETETEDDLAVIQEYMDKVGFETGSEGGFLFTGVPPGQYVIFTIDHGVVTSEFVVSPGEVVDLGKIEVSK
jgi:hypothetical protein